MGPRLPPDLTPSALARRLRVCADAIDLTESNPTRCVLPYDEVAVVRALRRPDALRYDPDPLGLLAAREAVADHLGRNGVATRPAHLALTTSTSEAYGILFKLWCAPGDAVAVPAPSYPLFAQLAQLESVRLLPYRVVYDRGWAVDLDSVRAVLANGVRALITVHPNHPTGVTLSPTTAQALGEACRAAGVPIISDEVFAAYGDGGAVPSITAWLGDEPGTVVVLDGLSKSAALPQMKLGWMRWHGPVAEVAEALAGVEWIADATLSVATPVQLAAAELLATAPAMQAAIRARLAGNRRRLAEALAAFPAVEVLEVRGGWYACLRVPRVHDEETWVLRLAERHGVKVHPGFFYDFEGEGILVTGLLIEPPRFEAAMDRLAEGLRAELL